MSTPQQHRRTRWLLLPVACIAAVALWYWRPWQPRIVIRERINPRDGAVMVWVPAGAFRMGRGAADDIRDAAWRRAWEEMRNSLRRRFVEPDESSATAHTVVLDDYWIYKFEVTVAQYRQFCRATGRAMPPRPAWGWQDAQPIVHVTWHDAATYAAWAGAALPTDAQWEKAARGPDGRISPWGNTWDGTKCSHAVGTRPRPAPSPVGSFPGDASPYGARDMTGNVSEWCADWFDAQYAAGAPGHATAKTLTGTLRVVRGGCWGLLATRYYRTTQCGGNYPQLDGGTLGFRCVWPAPR